MSVGLADDADRRPAGVAEDGHVVAGARQRGAQHRVAGERPAQPPSVVTQLADLGGGLVDQAGAPSVEETQRARTEQRVGAAALAIALEPGGGGESVHAEQEVDAGGIAAAHLEPVESGEHPLGRGQRVDQAGVAPAFGEEAAHATGEAEAIVSDRPRRRPWPGSGRR